MPSRNSGQTNKAFRTCGLSDQKPNGDTRQQRRAWLHVGFAEEERDACTGQHDRDAHRHVVDPRQRTDRAVQATKD